MWCNRSLALSAYTKGVVLLAASENNVPRHMGRQIQAQNLANLAYIHVQYQVRVNALS